MNIYVQVVISHQSSGDCLSIYYFLAISFMNKNIYISASLDIK